MSLAPLQGQGLLPWFLSGTESWHALCSSAFFGKGAPLEAYSLPLIWRKEHILLGKCQDSLTPGRWGWTEFLSARVLDGGGVWGIFVWEAAVLSVATEGQAYPLVHPSLTCGTSQTTSLVNVFLTANVPYFIHSFIQQLFIKHPFCIFLFHLPFF